MSRRRDILRVLKEDEWEEWEDFLMMHAIFLLSRRERRSRRQYEVIVKMAESFDKHSTRVMELHQQIAQHEKWLLEQTELESDRILFEEVSTFGKTIARCKRRLEEGILDGEVKKNVKFELRMARKMLKKAQEKFVQIYGEDDSE